MNPVLLRELRSLGGIAYLGQPYTGYAPSRSTKVDRLEDAATRGAKASAELHKLGIPHFSPIVHSHWTAGIGGLDHRDHGLWMPHCIAHLTRCSGLVVLMLPGWETSIGLNEERHIAEERDLPIMFKSPPDA